MPQPPPGTRTELLNAFADLRVADVRDGMDWCQLHGRGSLDRDVRPLFRTRAVGIARTYRYVPYTEPLPRMTPDQYTEWVGWYYREVCTFPWETEVSPGDFVVIEQSSPTGSILGSNNGLRGYKNGARGYVVAGGAVRDTDELILQKVPVWCQGISQEMVQARIRFESQEIPVTVGGVTVNPGDMVVADGDGVIVVPQGAALDVARYARRELVSDKASRKQLYQDIGLPLDDTVR